MIEKYAVDSSEITVTNDQLQTIEKLASKLGKSVSVSPNTSAQLADSYIRELEEELNAKSKR